jgi:hypothetical protein
MSDEPLITTLPAAKARIEHLIARVPALEVKVDVPTVEQVHVNDEVFRHPASEADTVAGVIGMMSGMMLLHDVAIENMQDVSDLEGHLHREVPPPAEDDEDEDEEED